MEDTVRSFNSLPRPRKIPSGSLPSDFLSDLPNHWVFGVRQVLWASPGLPDDFVFAVNTPSCTPCIWGPGQIQCLSNAPQKAQAMLPFLLKAFIAADRGPWRRPTDPPSFAPRTWATEDPELAEALEKCLSQHGVVDELCRVDTCSQDENRILDGAWYIVKRDLTNFVGQGAELLRPQGPLSTGDVTRCHGCGISCKDISEPLKKCAACGVAWYHSKRCQRNHWPEHKPACFANRSANASTLSSTGAASTKIDGHAYYNTTARASLAAQALMSTLHLSFPTSSTANEGIAIPLRSLIYTGKDTPKNMKLLFGPDWSSSIGKNYHETRIEILLDVPRGSLCYAMHQRLSPDSRLERSPRAATDSEKEMIRKVREVQDLIRRSIVDGKMPAMVDILAMFSSYGQDPNVHFQIYLHAINTMELGV